MKIKRLIKNGVRIYQSWKFKQKVWLPTTNIRSSREIAYVLQLLRHVDYADIT